VLFAASETTAVPRGSKANPNGTGPLEGVTTGSPGMPRRSGNVSS
jgi:hypothetical protein